MNLCKVCQWFFYLFKREKPKEIEKTQSTSGPTIIPREVTPLDLRFEN